MKAGVGNAVISRGPEAIAGARSSPVLRAAQEVPKFQEEDPETGFYYYKSRYYDPYSGRFMQPDSFTFPGQTGGMNRYMYVHGNPVKFDDPTGHSPWWKEADSWKTWAALAIIDSGGINQAMSNLSGNFNDGVNNLQGNLDDCTRGAGNFMSGLISNLEDAGPLLGAMPGMKEQAKRFSASWESGFPGQNGIRYNDTVGEMALLYHVSGMSPGSFGKMYGLALAIKAYRYNNTPSQTILGHSYTWNGNKDPFDPWNNHGNPGKSVVATILLLGMAKEHDISGDQAAAFVLMMRHLGPRPKSRLDLAAQRHDRGVPTGEWQGGGCQHIKADREFVNTIVDLRILNDTVPEIGVAAIATLYYGIVDQHIISSLNCRMGW